MTMFLLIVIAIVVYTVSLYIWPFGPCGKCKGTGRNAGSTGKRFGNCSRCDGSGRRQRFGSRFVHHTVLSFRGERARERERKRERDR